MTTSLTLVSLLALVVSFWSSYRRRSTEQELSFMERRIHQLAVANKVLEERVRWVEGRYARSMTLGKKLNQALTQEQARSRKLAERLQDSQSSAPTAPPARRRGAPASPHLLAIPPRISPYRLESARGEPFGYAQAGLA